MKFTKKDFEEIAEKYELGKYKSNRHIWHALENTVYFIQTTKGKYILKIFKKSNSKFIKYQIKMTDYLAKNKVLTPRILKTKSGKGIHNYKKHDITIQEFIIGEEREKLNNIQVKNIGKEIGRLNKKLLKLNLKGGDNWGKDHQFKLEKNNVLKINKLDIKKEEKSLIKDLKKINRKKLRKSIIHSDLGDSNLLFKNNNLVAIIDWDDAHRDYLIYELSAVISSFFISKDLVKKEQIKLFLKHYQKELKINSEEKKALYYFTKDRIIKALIWCVEQQREHKKRRKEIQKWIDDYLMRLDCFNKVELKEFLSLY